MLDFQHLLWSINRINKAALNCALIGRPPLFSSVTCRLSGSEVAHHQNYTLQLFCFKYIVASQASGIYLFQFGGVNKTGAEARQRLFF